MRKGEVTRGFTLIELLVAISIIAILSAVGLTLLSSAQATARDAKRKQDLADIRKALYVYRNNRGTFCLWNGGTKCSSTVWAFGVSDATYGYGSGDVSGLKLTLLPYLKSPALDPRFADTAAKNYYIYIPSDEHFELFATLENGPSAAEVTSCSPASGSGSDQKYCLGCNLNNDGASGERNYCISE